MTLKGVVLSPECPFSSAGRLIALAIGDHFNGPRGSAWPSVSRLAALTGLSPATVKRHLPELTAGRCPLLVLGRRGRTNLYQLNPVFGDENTDADLAQNEPSCEGNQGQYEPGRTADRDHSARQPGSICASDSPQSEPRSRQEEVDKGSRETARSLTSYDAFQEQARKHWHDRYGHEPYWTSKDEAKLSEAFQAAQDAEAAETAWLQFLKDRNPCYRGHSPKHFATQIDRWLPARDGLGSGKRWERDGDRLACRAGGVTYRLYPDGRFVRVCPSDGEVISRTKWTPEAYERLAQFAPEAE